MSATHRGKPFNTGERDTVLKVFEYFRTSNSDKSVDFAVSRTSEATGISKRSVYRLRTEQKKGSVKTPRKTKIRNVYKNCRTVKYDGFTISAIRKTVHSFLKRNVPPTMKHVLVKTNEDPDLPNFKKTTLYRLLMDSGFAFEKHSNKSLLIEKDSSIVCRHSYLRKIRECKKYNNPIVYVGETWVNVGQKVQKEGENCMISTPNEVGVVPFRSKESNDKGPHFVIVHAASEEGFLKNAKLMYLAQTSKDYHPSATMFEKWFKEHLLPNLQPNTAIVLDNTPYSSANNDIPNASSTKEDIKFWLLSKNVDFPDDSLKRELLHEVDQIKHLYSTSSVDEMAEYQGCRIIRLPPHHCELNPIEFAFNQVKEMLRMQNKEEIMIPMIDQAFDALTAEHWRQFFNYVEKTEKSMWEVDYLQDEVEHLFSQLNTSSDEDEESSDEVFAQISYDNNDAIGKIISHQ
ncbi:hypothetical protein LSTR_LSTR011045 [Laodelphax striatellus]|uniref:Tc1-like transposase DDE domain-containing protein n=1 Tax=Laodelphax striatellus TaxID=195883 RepID=A0A482WGL0_LAOST|nr:hypothetical protein LSTR_LSTR011045 [Laodelphax striatellus]